VHQKRNEPTLLNCTLSSLLVRSRNIGFRLVLSMNSAEFLHLQISILQRSGQLRRLTLYSSSLENGDSVCKPTARPLTATYLVSPYPSFTSAATSCLNSSCIVVSLSFLLPCFSSLWHFRLQAGGPISRARHHDSNGSRPTAIL